jgi:hypothetical protein
MGHKNEGQRYLITNYCILEAYFCNQTGMMLPVFQVHRFWWRHELRRLVLIRNQFNGWWTVFISRQWVLSERNQFVGQNSIYHLTSILYIKGQLITVDHFTQLNRYLVGVPVFDGIDDSQSIQFSSVHKHTHIQSKGAETHITYEMLQRPISNKRTWEVRIKEFLLLGIGQAIKHSKRLIVK